MSLPWQAEPFATEPERYELDEALRWHFACERRTFLQALGGGIAVLLLLPRDVVASGVPAAGDLAANGQDPNRDATIAAWLQVAGNGAISVFTGKVDVGQDVRTLLAQAVAEELHVDPHQLELVLGDTARVPFDRGTFGSRTTPAMAPQLRANGFGSHRRAVAAVGAVVVVSAATVIAATSTARCSAVRTP